MLERNSEMYKETMTRTTWRMGIYRGQDIVLLRDSTIYF